MCAWVRFVMISCNVVSRSVVVGFCLCQWVGGGMLSRGLAVVEGSVLFGRVCVDCSASNHCLIWCCCCGLWKIGRVVRSVVLEVVERVVLMIAEFGSIWFGAMLRFVVYLSWVFYKVRMVVSW